MFIFLETVEASRVFKITASSSTQRIFGLIAGMALPFFRCGGRLGVYYIINERRAGSFLKKLDWP